MVTGGPHMAASMARRTSGGPWLTFSSILKTGHRKPSSLANSSHSRATLGTCWNITVRSDRRLTMQYTDVLARAASSD